MLNRIRDRISAGRREWQLLKWKAAAALSQSVPRPVQKSPSRIPALQNSLKNSGPFPVDPASVRSDRVLAAVNEPMHRQTGVAGFEGFALDDALAYSDEYKHYSFFREAKAIARIADLEFGRRNISLLELGCGGGDLRKFLRIVGIRDYLGVDANPVAFNESPNIAPHREHFRLLNLQEEINFNTSFDMVCTFEVLEHIREDMLDGLMRTIINHVGPQSLFLGTASLQEEYDVHITVKPRGFWLERFAKHGLVPHPNAAAYETLLAVNHPFNWDASNTNVFALRRATGK